MKKLCLKFKECWCFPECIWGRIHGFLLSFAVPTELSILKAHPNPTCNLIQESLYWQQDSPLWHNERTGADQEKYRDWPAESFFQCFPGCVIRTFSLRCPIEKVGLLWQECCPNWESDRGPWSYHRFGIILCQGPQNPRPSKLSLHPD